MKRVLSTLLTLAAMLLMFASSPVAQDLEKPVDFYIGVGAGVPTGDLADGWKLGFHGLARVGFSVAPKLDVLAGLDYHTFPIDDLGVPSVSGGSFSTINITGDLKVNFGMAGASSNPFLLGGVGLSIYSISDLSVGTVTVEFDSESDIFIEVGGGVEFNKFFAQIKYVNIFAEGISISYIPFTVGVKF